MIHAQISGDGLGVGVGVPVGVGVGVVVGVGVGELVGVGVGVLPARRYPVTLFPDIITPGGTEEPHAPPVTLMHVTTPVELTLMTATS